MGGVCVCVRARVGEGQHQPKHLLKLMLQVTGSEIRLRYTLLCKVVRTSFYLPNWPIYTYCKPNISRFITF